MNKSLELKDIQTFTTDHENWSVGEDALIGEFKFKNFTEAFGFLTQVAMISEKMNHHAKIENMYNRVTLHLTTHDAGNTVTEKDIEFAKAVERVLQNEVKG